MRVPTTAWIVFAALGGCAATAPRPATGELESGNLVSGGRSRTFLYFKPPASAAPPPLLISLHGRLGDGAGQEKLTHILEVARKQGFALVLPDGHRRSWADARGRTPASQDAVDDLAFLSALIDLFISRHGVDASRVYLVGMSNGGFMSLTAACALSDRLAGVVSVTGLVSEALKQSCHPSRPLSVALVVGEEDPLVPYAGGELAGDRGAVLSAVDSARLWAQLDGCADPPSEEALPDADPSDGTQSRRMRWTGCRDDVEVALVSVRGGGHTWPGGLQYLGERIVGRTARDFSANQWAWDFLRRFARRDSGSAAAEPSP